MLLSLVSFVEKSHTIVKVNMLVTADTFRGSVLINGNSRYFYSAMHNRQLPNKTYSIS